MTYDANGNLTSDSLQRTFTWNVLDQLTNFTRPTVTASFSYDPLGRRTSLINGSTNKSYLYDGQNMLKDGIADFLNGANIDEPLEYESSSHSWNYFQDHLGSSTQLRNTGDGASVQRYDYKSYGKLEGNLSNTTSTTTALTYTGREDDNTGLYYYRNRYYDPNLELFISQDPLGDAQRYVGGNPLSYTDPLGLERFQNPNCLLGSAYDDAGNYVGCKENSLLPSFILDWPFNGGVRSAASFIPCKISSAVQFGGNPNAAYHAFRHIDKAGLSRKTIQEAILKDLIPKASQFKPGDFYKGSVRVNGMIVRYNSKKLESGIVNVGSIFIP